MNLAANLSLGSTGDGQSARNQEALLVRLVLSVLCEDALVEVGADLLRLFNVRRGRQHDDHPQCSGRRWRTAVTASSRCPAVLVVKAVTNRSRLGVRATRGGPFPAVDVIGKTH